MADRQDEIFISYSRQNSDFVNQLVAELGKHDVDPWFDIDDIPKSREWWREIQKGIEGANAFVFIISAGSLQSQVCNWELAHALNLSKKIIPILYEDVFANKDLLTGLPELVWDDPDGQQINAGKNWKKVADLNFVRYCDAKDLLTSVDEVVVTARTDFEYREQHTTLYLRASDWQRRNKDSGFLLIENELKEAQEWLENIEGKEPPPTELHVEYIQASVKRNRQLRRIRWTAVVGIIVAMIAIVASLVAGQSAVDAIDLRAAVQDTAYRLQMMGQAQLNQNNENDAMAFAFEAMSFDQPPIDLLRPFYNIAGQSRNRATFFPGLRGIYSVAFSPNGLILASANSANRITLWDVVTGEKLATLRGHENMVFSVAFSPDGSTLASASWDSTIRLWDVETGKELTTLGGHSKGARSVAFSPDGLILASGGMDYIVKLWDMETRTAITTLTGHTGSVNSVAFSPDGTTLVSGSVDNTIKLWDVTTRAERATLSGHEDWVNSVVFSPDGDIFASGDNDGIIKLWDMTTKEEITTFTGHTGSVDSVAFSPDGVMLASGSGDRTIKLWDVATGDTLATLTGHSDSVWGVAFSPDGQIVASGSQDSTVKLWDIKTSDSPTIDNWFLTTFNGHERDINSIAFSPNGEILASGGDDETIKLWDMTTEEEITTLTGHSSTITSVAFSPDGTTLVSGSYYDDTIKLWDVRTGETLATLTTGYDGFGYSIRDVAFSPDGQIITVAIGSIIKLWDVGTGETLILTGHDNSINSIAFSPTGEVLVSAGCAVVPVGNCPQGVIKLWNVATGTELATLTGHDHNINSIAFSPNGQTIASGSRDETIKLWDVVARAERATLTGHTGSVDSVAFSPDGTMLLSVSRDFGSIKLWDVESGEEVASLSSDYAHNVGAFNPVSSLIATAGQDYITDQGGIIELWNIASLPFYRQWVQANRHIREFTCEERERFNMPVKCDDRDNYPLRTPYPALPTQVAVELEITPFWYDQTKLANVNATAQASD